MTRNRLLGAIAQGKVSRKDAAAEAGVSVRTVNRWMVTQNVKRPPSRTAREKDTRALKEKARRHAIGVTRDLPPKVPAALLGLSVRTIKRLREKYLGNSDGE